jgi:putative hydrolase of the HAD superfamily
MASGVLFDLDGTLFDRDSAVRFVALEQHRYFAQELRCVAEDAYVERIVALDAHGYADKAKVYQQVLAELRLPTAFARTLVADFWDRYRSSYHPFPEVERTLRALRDQSFALGIITNGKTSTQQSVITRHGFDRFMNVILISEREGTRKPNREIFDRALLALHLRPDDACYVGDHPDVDVAGAVAAGMRAFWRRTPYWAEPSVPHRAIQKLDELVPLLSPSAA